MRGVIIMLGMAIMWTGCGKKDTLPEGILPPGKMQPVLWDVIRADAYTSNYIKKDSSKKAVEENAKLQNRIFNNYNVSRASFYKSYDYYKSNTELFKVLLDSMINWANRERDLNFQSKIPLSK
jgi:hypothetical protein